ncbi:hypothetical protein COOONC_28634 [Cooperia oncophora]
MMKPAMTDTRRINDIRELPKSTREEKWAHRNRVCGWEGKESSSRRRQCCAMNTEELRKFIDQALARVKLAVQRINSQNTPMDVRHLMIVLKSESF